MIKQFYSTHRYDPYMYYFSELSGPGSNGNEDVLHILQNWNLTIRCSLVSYSEYYFYLTSIVTTTPSRSGPGEMPMKVYIFQSSRIEASKSNAV